MAHAEPRQSYGAGLTRPNVDGDSANWIGRRTGVPYTRRERSADAGRPGRSVAASASALGAEDRRFESCRPDSVKATKRLKSQALPFQDRHGTAGVAQWQSPSLPSWPCEFDSRHPLQCIAPSQLTFQSAKLFQHPDNKNNQAGHMYSMIIDLRSTEVPCQAPLLRPRISLR